jgi:copper chaperone CopZ
MQKRSYSVSGMECPNCAMILEMLEDKLPGIKRISASYQKQHLDVEFDERELNEADFIKAVEEKGYHLTER